MIANIALADLGQFLGVAAVPPLPSCRSLTDWRMEEGDAPILTYVYSALQPRRHLEFGTWVGFGTCLCLESCSAGVWTINLPEGETRPDGSWAYGERLGPSQSIPAGSIVVNFGSDDAGPRDWLRTDAGSSIGRLYRERGLGHRVAQILCNSRDWDTSPYPQDFFDTVLIDGGHSPDVVASDTQKALEVLRPGGVILWHDFCPLREVAQRCESVRGVTEGIASLLPELGIKLRKLAWIDPSWILIGIKA